jgi:uncharacterized glyoxalase superfamily protein PhnB
MGGINDMTNTATGRATTVWPAFRYRDAPAAIRFLKEAFGFEEVVVYPGESADVVAHAELRWPDGGGVMLGSDHDDGMGPQPGAGSVYIVTEDVAAVHDRAQRAGAEIVRPLRAEEYDAQTFTARDPEGVLWSFGTYGGASPA